MARLATHIWISAYLHRLTAEGIYAHIVHRGDATAGAVAVKVSFMDGRASLWSRAFGVDGRLAWDTDMAERPEAEVDEAIARRRARDRDLWVVEVEDPRGRHLLGDPAFGE